MVKQAPQKRDESPQNESRERDVAKAAFEFGTGDDVIAALANSYENRRARQVYEWELLRKRVFQSPV